MFIYSSWGVSSNSDTILKAPAPPLHHTLLPHIHKGTCNDLLNFKNANAANGGN